MAHAANANQFLTSYLKLLSKLSILLLFLHSLEYHMNDNMHEEVRKITQFYSRLVLLVVFSLLSMLL